MVSILNFQSLHLVEQFYDFGLYEKHTIKLLVHLVHKKLDFSSNWVELISNSIETALDWHFYADVWGLSGSLDGIVALFGELN